MSAPPPIRERFVGRDRELAALRDQPRVTVVGPPGVGKTRLVLEHLRQTGGRVCWVASPTEEVLAEALRALAPDEALVVDDLDPTPAAGRLLAGSAGRLLLTARRPLGRSDETVLRLGPLDPDTDGTTLLAERAGLIPSEALRLVARRLDGFPLALELAAVRLRTVGTAALDASVAELLGTNTVDRAHRSWDAALAPSWDALSTAETHLLGVLAVFRGPATADDLRAVGDGPPLVALEGLVDRSLATTDGGIRTWAPIAAWVRSRLAPDVRETLQRRHADRVLAVAEAVDPDDADGFGVLSWYAAELWAVADGADDTRAARATAALTPLVLEHGPLEPFLERLERLLARDLDPALRAGVHLAAGRAHRRLGGLRASRRHLRLASDGGDARVSARIEADRAMVLVSGGEIGAAREVLERSLAVPGTDRSLTLLRLGITLRELGDPAAARSSFVEALAGFRSSGDVGQVAITRAELAHAALALDDPAEARAWLDLDPATSPRSRAAIEARRALVAVAEEREEAERLLEDTIPLLARVGYRAGAAGLRGVLGLVRLASGRPDAARDTLGEARAEVAHDPRLYGLLSGWLAAVASARGDAGAARAARLGVGALDPHDPHSVAAHVAAGAVDRVFGDAAAAGRALALAELSGGNTHAHRARSFEVRLSIRAWWHAGSRPTDDTAVLRIDPDGRSFAPPHAEPVRCERWEALRGVLARLAEECLVRPGVPVPWRVLFAAGWPGQNILDSAARNRLKVAVATLRKLGLGASIAHAGDGYVLVGEVRITRIAS